MRIFYPFLGLPLRRPCSTFILQEDSAPSPKGNRVFSSLALSALPR